MGDDIRRTIETLAARGQPFRLRDVRAALGGRSYADDTLAEELKAAEADGLLTTRWVATGKEPEFSPGRGSTALDEEAVYAAFAAALGVERGETEEMDRDEYERLTAQVEEDRRAYEQAEAERARALAEKEAAEVAECDRLWQKWGPILVGEAS